MNMPRILNCLADCYTALRLAGFTPDEAQRIVTQQALKAVDSIPHRPYPQDADHADRDCEDERTTAGSD